MPELAIETKILSDAWMSITVEGEIDLATADELSTALDQALSNGTEHVVVDLNQSPFMDSTGLKTLVMAQRRMAENDRELVLAVKGGPISRLIDVSGIESSIRVVATVEDVLS
jgi:anti-anti-sigma factor